MANDVSIEARLVVEAKGAIMETEFWTVATISRPAFVKRGWWLTKSIGLSNMSIRIESRAKQLGGRSFSSHSCASRSA